MVACSAIAVWAAVQSLRLGWHVADYRWLLLAAVSSIPLFFLAVLTWYRVRIAPDLRGLSAAVILLLLIPYALGAYVALYRGLWGLTELLKGFSAVVVVRGIVLFLVGQRLVAALSILSESPHEAMGRVQGRDRP